MLFKKNVTKRGWALASVYRVPQYSRIKPKFSGPPTPWKREKSWQVVSATDVMYPDCPDAGYILYYFLQVESRLLIKPPRLFRRFRYFSWGVNHDIMFVCMICVVVYIIKTGKCLKVTGRTTKDSGFDSSSGAKILSSSPFPDRLLLGATRRQRVGIAVSH